MDFLRRYSNRGNQARLVEKAWQHVQSVLTSATAPPVLPRRRVHRLAQRLSLAQIESLLADHLAGHGLAQIARDHGLTEYAVTTVLKSCGVEPDSTRMTPDEIARAEELYALGHSIKHCATELGRAYSSVHKALTQSGIQLRPPRKPLTFTSDEVETLTQQYMAGDTLRAIATAWGVGAETIRRALRRHGVVLRPAVRYGDICYLKE